MGMTENLLSTSQWIITLVLFLLFLGYLALRRTTVDPRHQARRAAVVALVAVLDIPLVNRSVEWWENRTLHQQSTLAELKIQDLTLFTLMLGFVVFGLVGAWLLLHRFRVGWLEREDAEHGVATATACAMLGLECIVYMGSEDIQRQSLNVFRMKLLEAEVVPVESGTRTLKDAINEAIRDWVTNVETTHYLIGSVVGPHPYPVMVRDFQTVIGREARAQLMKAEGRLPDYVLACVGGGSNSIGIFHPFVPDEDVRLMGLEAGGEGIATGKHSATLSAGRPGVLHGAMSYLLQDEHGQVQETHSISAGLDYPGVGPEHSYLKDSGRAEYREVNDSQALDAFHLLCRTEGIIPALESSHAVHAAVELAKTLTPDQIVLVCLSGRGDKDIDIVAQASGLEI